jgi:hypothetical protein
MAATSISNHGETSIQDNGEKDQRRSDKYDAAFAQAGVQQVEAIATVWSTRMLWTVFAL